MTDNTLRDLLAGCFMWTVFVLVGFIWWTIPAVMKVIAR